MEATQIERERKFLVEDLDIEAYQHLHGTLIVQHYLIPDREGTIERVRSLIDFGVVKYFHTVKRHLAPGENEETERQIDHDEYMALRERVDPECHAITKVRKKIPWRGQEFELDLFQKPVPELLLLELETDDMEAPIDFPPWLKIGKEVTGDRNYTNFQIARGALG